MAAKLRSIEGVEIFSAGKWNDDQYSIKDLDDMVHAFNANRGQFRPYLKLGHDNEQKLLQEDGFPAAGWIGNLYRLGEKLIADFVDIPEKIYQLIENKAYRKVSSEIYWNLDIKGHVFPRMLSAVALLGADTPAVMNLNDILSMYGLKDFARIKIYANNENEDTVKTHDFIPSTNKGSQPMPKTEAELKLELELKNQKEESDRMAEELKKHKSDAEAKDAELETLRADKAKAEKAALDAELARQETERDAFVSSLAAEKLITPAMKPYIKALLGDTKEYSVKVKDADKKFSRSELVKEVLKLHTASDVNLEEGSEEGQEQTGNSDEKLNTEIEKYMDENKCSYKSAYKAVVKAKQPRSSAAMTEEQ